MIELIYILATFTLTLIIAEYEGPFRIFFTFRKTFNKTGDEFCFVCVSVWSGLLFAIIYGHYDHFMAYWFGFSGGAILSKYLLSKLDS